MRTFPEGSKQTSIQFAMMQPRSMTKGYFFRAGGMA